MFESLECIDGDVATAAAVDLDDVDHATLNTTLIRLRTIIARLEGLEVTLTQAHDHRQAWKTDGANSATQWHRDRRGLTAAQAARQVHTAGELTRLPQTAAKVADGEITVDKADIAARAARNLPAEHLAALDTLMVDTAPTADTTTVRHAVTRFSHDVDPGSLQARERLAYQRRGIRMGACADGGVWIDGRLDIHAGEAALTVTSTLAAPTGDGDDRTSDQRLADAVGDIFVRALRYNDDIPSDGGRPPAIAALVDWTTLQAAPGAPAAELEHQGPISSALARQLACDAAVHRIITRGPSEILDLGRTQRTVSLAQRRALIARDRGCIGCTAPPAWTDAHQFAEPGSTKRAYDRRLAAPDI